MVKAAIVKSSDLKRRWGAGAVLSDPTIQKYCVTCGGKLTQTSIWENGKLKEDVLYCQKCKEFFE